MNPVKAYLATLLLEMPIALGLARQQQQNLTRVALVSCLGSTLSHPVAWFVLRLPSLSGLPSWFAVELLVIVAEAWLFMRLVPCRPGQAAFLSCASNGCSAAAAYYLYS